MNGQVTAETIKMLVQANNTIADVLEMLAVESKRLENKGLPTEDIERNRQACRRSDQCSRRKTYLYHYRR